MRRRITSLARGRHILDEHVATHRVSARSQAPDVQVVDVQHAVDRFHRGRYLRQRHPAGNPSSRIFSDSRTMSQAV